MIQNNAILKVAKLFKNFNAILPIIENVALTGARMFFTDLDYFVSIPYKTAFKTTFPIRSLIAALETFVTPIFALVDGKIHISQGKELIKTGTDELDNFPKSFAFNSVISIGKIMPDILSFLVTAVSFVSHDDLTPALNAIQVHKHIAATDAHRLYFEKLKSPLTEAILIPPKIIKVMEIFKDAIWEVFVEKKAGDNPYDMALLRNEDNVEISFRIPDVAFPDWKVVIPKITKETPVVFVDKKELRKAIKTGSKFGHAITKRSVLQIGKSSYYHTEDIDMSTEYTTEIYIPNVKIPITLSLNWDFLDEILKISPDIVSLDYSEANKAIILDKRFLMMPIIFPS